MASAVELVWQWAYLVAILLIVLVLAMLFWRLLGKLCSECERVLRGRRSTADFAPFRKKRKKVAVVTTDGPAPEGDVVVRTADGRKIVVAEQEEIDPWGTLCGGVLSVITFCYCCGALKPDGEGEEEGEEMLPKKKRVVAQPVTIVSPAPAKQPQAPVVKAEPLARVVPPLAPVVPPPPPRVRPAVEIRAPPREIGQGTASHIPLLQL